ncbi:MAG: DUF4136 domain-containing protein [Pseudomonadota bacterium]|nr:DUF4136 domain-containing protein [Pseudomonadota bacterium]MDQ3228450.1 DUF4136 domain-containing protein [Pseudomonadota bacterium]
MQSFRSTATRWLAIAALLSLLAACATGPRIRTDYDPEADFGRYRSYAFYQPIAMETSGYSTYITDRVKTNIRREMQARGYTYNETSPDLRVNFQGIVEERTDVYSMPRVDYQYYYSYRARSYVAVPVWYDEAQVSRYTEGTLTVDVVDAARNRMVWTGDAIGRVTQRTPQERAAQVDRSITDIFAKYPYRAGSGQPVVAE